MTLKIFAVRIGEKYNQDVEDYINSKLPNVTWIRSEIDGIRLQWNKLSIMNLDIDEPVLVIDIDMLFINDYMDAINYPIKRGEFLTANSWWGDSNRGNFSLNGGFQKYYPKDCKYIYDEFMKKPDYWMKYFIENKITYGEVNGEQFFVEIWAKKRLEIKYLPDSWFVKYDDNFSKEDYYHYNIQHPKGWVYLGGEFNESIKIVHFMNTNFDLNLIKKYDLSY